MLVSHDIECRLWAPRSRFPFMRRPSYWHTDFPWENGLVNAGAADGLIADYELQALIPAPLRVPHNALFGTAPSAGYTAALAEAEALDAYDDALPSVTWTKTIQVGSVEWFPVAGGFSNRSLGVSAVAPAFDDGNANAMECRGVVDAHGAVVSLQWRPTPRRQLAAGDLGGVSAPTEPPEAYVGVSVGSDAEKSEWRVLAPSNGDFRIEQRLPGGDWEPVETLAVSNRPAASVETYTEGQAEAPLEAEFRLLGGRMQIRVGDISRVLTFEEERLDAEELLVDRITQVFVGAARFQGATFYAEPLKWRRECSYTSAEITVGFSSSEHDEPDMETIPGSYDAGWMATFESDLTGPIVTYTLSLEGPEDGTYNGVEFSDLALGVRAVNLRWPGEVEYSPAAPWELLPYSVRIDHQFDPASLSIGSRASLHFSANREVLLPGGAAGTWGGWNAARGQGAIEVWGQRSLASGYPGEPWLQFTGYAHSRGVVQGGEGASSFAMHCVDRRVQLMSERWALPWMDGWNVYYAIAYLAQLGGISMDDMTFESLVPDAPMGEGSDLGDGAGGPAYYLPVGSMGSVLTRFNGQQLWHVMLKLAGSIGYLLCFDRFGRLVFQKFQLPAGTKRAFFESDRESSAQPAGGLEGCWDIAVESDLSEVRSESILVGVDAFAPRWDPIVFRQEDAGVVDDPDAFNHLGYRNPAVIMDTQFAQEGYAEDASLAMMRFMRLPGLSASFTTWYQPDLFPMDVVSVESYRMGISGVRLMVVGVCHDIDIGMARSTITARLVPE